MNKIKKFFNSPVPIIIMLIIIIIVLLINTNYLMKSNKIYLFSASNDYVKINNGVISLNYDINILEGSDITYLKDKDITVTKYKIGYYVKDNDKLIPLSIIEDNDEGGFSLKALLEGINTFNINELNKNNNHFNKESTKLLNDGLYFIIEATDNKGNVISEITKTDLIKISK